MRYCTASYGWMAVVAFGGDVDVTHHSLDVQAVVQHCGIPRDDILHVSESADTAPSHLLFLDHKHRCVVFAIRGTWTMTDIITDLSAHYVPFKNGNAHGGIVCVL